MTSVVGHANKEPNVISCAVQQYSLHPASGRLPTEGMKNREKEEEKVEEEEAEEEEEEEEKTQEDPSLASSSSCEQLQQQKRSISSTR